MRFLILFLFYSTFLSSQSLLVDLKDGDFLFQDLDCGALCEAIEGVTEGIDGRDFSHCGLVHSEGDSIFVLEAIGPGVIKTSLQKFVQRSGEDNIVSMRLKQNLQGLVPGAVRFIQSKMGAAYDDIYDLANEKYYCSELLYEAFKNSNQGEELFDLNLMTFKSPKTGLFDVAWVEYFKGLNVKIPEGKQGINPGAISRSEYLVRIR